MDKRDVVKQIQEYLGDELATLDAEADTDRISEIKRLLLMYRFLPVRDFGPEDLACPAALLTLELNGNMTYCYIAPQGGGLITAIDGKPVQVVTPQSPLGEALLGRRSGETVTIESKQGPRQYKILSVR